MHRDYSRCGQRIRVFMFDEPHIISRCYYAMYHAARAVILHVRRADVDDHERLPAALSQVLGTNYGDTLGQWREMRNQVDYSPYAPADLASQVATALSNANALLTACRDHLKNRGVSLNLWEKVPFQDDVFGGGGMKIKEQAIKELESLGPSELVTVYEMITALKAKPGERRALMTGERAYLRVRRALASCEGSLSEDILLLREDRV